MVSYTTSMLTIDVRYDSSFDLHSSRNELNASGTLPSSCADLSKIGHYLNGIYMITNEFSADDEDPGSELQIRTCR